MPSRKDNKPFDHNNSIRRACRCVLLLLGELQVLGTTNKKPWLTSCTVRHGGLEGLGFLVFGSLSRPDSRVPLELDGWNFMGRWKSLLFTAFGTITLFSRHLKIHKIIVLLYLLFKTHLPSYLVRGSNYYRNALSSQPFELTEYV